MIKYLNIYLIIVFLWFCFLLFFVGYFGIYYAILSKNIANLIANSFCFVLTFIYSFFSIKKLINDHKMNKIISDRIDKND